MKKKEAVEEFSHILPEILKEYGSDDNNIRYEIWEMYLNHLKATKRITKQQKDGWHFPRDFKFQKNTALIKNI